MLRLLGATIRPGVPAAISSWLRECAGILAVAPAVLVCASWRLKEWVGFPAEREWQPITVRDVMELGLEVAAWTATLWMTVHFRARYGLNVTYLTFLPPLALTLHRGMRLAAPALALNAVAATTLWSLLPWGDALSAGDLRLLVAIYSLIILVLAAVVDERQHDRGQVEKLRVAEAAMRESEERFRRVFEEGPLGFALVGTDYRFAKVNRALCEMVGYRKPRGAHLRKAWVSVSNSSGERYAMTIGYGYYTLFSLKTCATTRGRLAIEFQGQD
jgi:PAS domain-containing protein